MLIVCLVFFDHQTNVLTIIIKDNCCQISCLKRMLDKQMDKQTKLLTMKIITSTMKIIIFFSFKNIQYLLWGTTNCYSQKCYFQVACSLAFWYADEQLSLTNLSQGRLSAKLILKYRKNFISNYLLKGGLCFGLWGFFFGFIFFSNWSSLSYFKLTLYWSII